MDIARYLQSQGVGSKKLCRALYQSGRVRINHTLPEAEIDPAAVHSLHIDNSAYCVIPLPFFYLLLHKPAATETSHKPRDYPSVFSLLPHNMQNLPLQAVGRLDADTTGALIITNDGQFNHRATSPKTMLPKTYRVGLKHSAGEDFCAALCAGVLLHDEQSIVQAASARLEDAKTLEMVITSGKYHQVKRMIAAAGNRVETLHRSRFGASALDGLAEGCWRFIRPETVFGTEDAAQSHAV